MYALEALTTKTGMSVLRSIIILRIRELFFSHLAFESSACYTPKL
jgi:hypothetical protein